MTLDFPLPVAPINATVSPFFALKLILRRIGSSESGYVKLTFLNSISPIIPGFPSVSLPSVIFAFVSSTSSIRLADTETRGSIMKTILTIINAMTTCIA